jgi:putative endonuclease
MAQRRATTVVGAWGEERACHFLIRQKFRIIERNYHTTAGEIDIIAEKGGDYYFIEVKTRAKGEMATDLAITPAKIRKLQKTVKMYCYQRNIADRSLILAGLLLTVDRKAERLAFRLAVFC